MRKYFLLLPLLFPYFAYAQGTQIVTVTADPLVCNTGMLYFNSTSNILKSCGPNNTWVTTSATPGVFNLANYGGVDDNSTDNCSGGTNAVALFTAAVNAYSGPGVPQAIIPAGASNKAYKLATNSNSCTFQFTNSKGTAVHLWGNLNCAQTAQACIILGATNTAGASFTGVNQNNFSIDGFGALIDGRNLTNVPVGQTASAGIYIEPQINTFWIDGINFYGATGQNGFGAVNATLGNCTNYSIFVDYPVGSGYIKNVYAAVNSTSSTSGGCGIGNPNGSTVGSNSIFINHNIIGTAGNAGLGNQCGSIGILDGGAFGDSSHNELFGFGMPWRLQGLGHTIVANEIDSALCSAKGVNAAFHVGANGSSTAVQQVTIAHNKVQGTAIGTTNLVTIAGDSTATMTEWTITNNLNTEQGAPTNIALFNGTPSCAVQVTAATPCVIGGNQGFNTPAVGSGTTGVGWAMQFGVICELIPAIQTANLGSTLMCNAPITHTYLFVCYNDITTAGTTSTLPSCTISYTDAISGAATSQTVTATNTGNTLGLTVSGIAVLTPTAGTAINMSTTGYASSGTVMHYQPVGFLYTY